MPTTIINQGDEILKPAVLGEKGRERRSGWRTAGKED